MGNCANCCGKSDIGEIQTKDLHASKRKGVNAEAGDILIGEITKSGKEAEITKIQASFRGHQARKEAEQMKKE